MNAQHSHGHGHGHVDAENPFAGQGSVLLDIGALVVAMPAAMLDVEIEIHPVGADVQGHHPHVAVVARPTGDQTVPSLVFGELTEGSYELYEKGGGPVRLTVPVGGGVVTEATWP
jgi:hypothetical protein